MGGIRSTVIGLSLMVACIESGVVGQLTTQIQAEEAVTAALREKATEVQSNLSRLVLVIDRMGFRNPGLTQAAKAEMTQRSAKALSIRAAAYDDVVVCQKDQATCGLRDADGVIWGVLTLIQPGRAVVSVELRYPDRQGNMSTSITEYELRSLPHGEWKVTKVLSRVIS